MNCKACGKKLTDGIEVCAHCGTVNKFPFYATKKGKIIIASIIGVLVIAGIICAAVMLGDDKPEVVKIHLKDEFTVTEDGIEVGTVTAEYYDKSEDKNIKVEITDYKLYIDDEEVAVDDGMIQTELEEGEYELRFEWIYEEQEYEYTQPVYIENFDPWGYFLERNVIGETLEEMEEKVGKLDNPNEERTDWDHVTHLEEGDGDYMFGDFDCLYSDEGMAYSFYYRAEGMVLTCHGIGGTAEQLFGIKEDISISEFESMIDISEPFALDYTLDIMQNHWCAKVSVDGCAYDVAIYSDALRPIELKAEYDIFLGGTKEEPLVTPSNIRSVYNGAGEGYDVITPSTRMTVTHDRYTVYD